MCQQNHSIGSAEISWQQLSSWPPSACSHPHPSHHHCQPGEKRKTNYLDCARPWQTLYNYMHTDKSGEIALIKRNHKILCMVQDHDQTTFIPWREDKTGSISAWLTILIVWMSLSSSEGVRGFSFTSMAWSGVSTHNMSISVVNNCMRGWEQLDFWVKRYHPVHMLGTSWLHTIHTIHMLGTSWLHTIHTTYVHYTHTFKGWGDAETIACTVS